MLAIRCGSPLKKHYSARRMRFGSRGPSCRSSWLRQRNALTGKAWEDAVDGLGKEKIRFWIVAEVEAFKNT